MNNRLKKYHFIYILSTVVFIRSTYEYKTGAPAEAVADMMPDHGVAPQPLPSPYNVTSNRWKLRPGCLASVYIKSKNRTIPFRGFLVTAKDNINATVGTFMEDEDYKLLSFGEGHDNAATHLNNTEKFRMTVYWKAPPILKGPIRFLTTIVKDKETYWVGESSEDIKVERYV